MHYVSVLRLLAKVSSDFTSEGFFFHGYEINQFFIATQGSMWKSDRKVSSKTFLWILQSIWSAVLMQTNTAVLCVICVRTLPLSWEWRDANNGPQRVESRWACEWIAHRPSAVSLLFPAPPAGLWNQLIFSTDTVQYILAEFYQALWDGSISRMVL